VGDGLQFLVDEQVGAGEAPRRAEEVRQKLISEGLIDSVADKDSTLFFAGHRPGPQVASWYEGNDDDLAFTRLRTNGVIIRAGRFTNLAAGPYDTGALVCPRCGRFADTEVLFESVGAWMSGSGDATFACGACSATLALRALRTSDPSDPPVVCGNLSLTFFNWPTLSTRIGDEVSSTRSRTCLARARPSRGQNSEAL
jgi:hypothetical protein